MKRGSSVPSLTPAQASRLSWPWALAAQHGGGIQTGAALTLTESQALGEAHSSPLSQQVSLSCLKAFLRHLLHLLVC